MRYGADMWLARPALECRPPLWARSGHVQTLVGNALRFPALHLPCEHIEIALPDGDRLSARRFAGEQPIVLCVFHGLGGHADRTYMRRVLALGVARGWEVWLVNHRGCGQGRGLARGTYHSGVAADLGAVFARARQQRPDARVVAVGFSLSGNALLLNLGDGREGPHPKPDAAIAVNPPVDLAACSQLISAPRHKIYNTYFIRGCVRAVRQREEDGLIPAGKYPVRLGMSLAAFDDSYTAPAAGFADRHDYYARCSSLPYLSKIRTPTVILHAEDDPFIHANDLRNASLGAGIHLHLEPTGGHLGYVARDLPQYRWMDYALGHYLDALMSHLATR